MRAPAPARAGSRPEWDAVVIGAGPAGAAAAALLAEAGRRVLLAERRRLPREKVCGGCLHAGTLALLERFGRPPLAAAAPLRRAMVYARGRAVALPLAGGAVLGRAELDAWLVARAQERGAHLLDGCRAVLGSSDRGGARVRLETTAGATEVSCTLVIDASGLAGRPAVPAGARARVGLGLIAPASGSALAAGTVHMALGRGGYVGIVQRADRRLQVAACVRERLVRRYGPGRLVDRILVEAGLQPLGYRQGWQGTPPLRATAGRLSTCRRVRLGDAAAFWEPFTGEGIGWALASALRSRAALVALSGSWDPDTARAWAVDQRRWLRRVQRRSRAAAWLAGGPARVRAAVAVAALLPAAFTWLLPEGPQGAPLGCPEGLA